METSRIFIRGLPPTITETELRKHFSVGGREVTDLKAIPQRRIGYVGFKTPEAAKKAVKYFNRSYIRMSRLSVELARPIGDPALGKSFKGRDIPIVSEKIPKPTPTNDDGETNARKRKRDQPDESDPKLREYLQVFQPGKNSANDLVEMGGSAAAAEQKKILREDESDDEYESIPKRPEKRQMKEAPSNSQPKQENRNELPDAPPPDEENETESSGSLPEAGDSNPKPAGPDTTGTDDDWLRSRTSRVLDLVDADEVMTTSLPQGDEPQETNDNPRGDLEEASSDHESQGPENPAEDAPTVPEESTEDAGLSTVRQTARLFVRNLAYSVSEDDLREHFEQYGELEEVHIPVAKSGAPKGFAMIQFTNADSAVAAFQSSDGQTFQGRLLHVLPATARRDVGLDEFELSKLPLKKQNMIRKKAEAASSTFNWNSLYMSQDAVNTSVANRLGVSKAELLDPTDASAAVKQALAESTIINETKRYFVANGVDLNAFKSQKRGDTCILVKNFAHGTTLEELRTLFEEHGTVLQVLMPPSGTIAVVQFALPAQGKAAFSKLAYRRIKDSVLFLEKGPKDLLGNEESLAQKIQAQEQEARQAPGIQKLSVSELLERDGQEDGDGPGTGETTTSLFVKNLAFATNTQQLAETFRPLEGFVSARVKTKTDPKRPGQVLSMGFGFVEFRTSEQALAAAKVMNGYVLEGHKLAVKTSHKGLDAAEERRREDKAKKAAGQRTKIVIKNLPFEATKKDLRTLFGTYGQLRAVRIPKKFGHSSRGFAFAEFVTPRDAENARNSLQDTHLLGRRLVLDFAEAEALDAEEEIAKMQKKVGGQVDRVLAARLTTSGRNRKKVKGITGEDNEDGFE